jgi:hypothetical protein
LQFKASPANSSQDPISKIPITKRAGRMAQGKGPKFKPKYGGGGVGGEGKPSQVMLQKHISTPPQKKEKR